MHIALPFLICAPRPSAIYSSIDIYVCLPPSPPHRALRTFPCLCDSHLSSGANRHMIPVIPTVLDFTLPSYFTPSRASAVLIDPRAYLYPSHPSIILLTSASVSNTICLMAL